jgi:hypothetical protein
MNFRGWTGYRLRGARRLLHDLSAHQKFLFAEPKNDGSGSSSLARRDLFDPTSEEIGQLFSVTIGPGINPQNGQFTGEISVKIRGEYFVDNFFDPISPSP